MAWAEAYLPTKWHLDIFSRLSTTDMGQKVGGCCAPPLFEGELGPHLTQCRLGRGLRGFTTMRYINLRFTYLLTIKWHLDPSSHLATTYMGQRLGYAPLAEGVLGSHLTQCGQGRGLPPCQVSSSYIQPFGYNTPTYYIQDTEDRQTGVQTDNGTIASGEPFYKQSPTKG